ncbi:MAG: phage holin family protein [Lewinellaceae bacterium]|nr:phage holin family protein [Lewinellaceae bacterium]MCB9329812.1 phage holin family protein [Lewinellaceae bacterium]
MRFLIALLINGLVIYACAAVFSGIQVAGYGEAVIAALLLAVVNFLLRPALILLTLPITIITLGLFLLVINGAMVLLADWMLDGFNVAGLGWAILLSIVLSIANFFNNRMEDKHG